MKNRKTLRIALTLLLLTSLQQKVEAQFNVPEDAYDPSDRHQFGEDAEAQINDPEVIYDNNRDIPIAPNPKTKGLGDGYRFDCLCNQLCHT